MEMQELHHGRLIDHIQLVVRDPAAVQRFYTAIFDALSIPMAGSGEGFFGQTSCSSRPPTARMHKGS